MEDTRKWEPALEPEDLARFFVARANDGDAEGLARLYEPDAVLACPGGKCAVGSAAIRRYFTAMLAQRPKFEPGEQRPALRTGDGALTSSRLVNGAVTAEIARKQADGTWLWAVDQPSISE